MTMPTVLIVEDNETNMKLSSFLLETADYSVLMATTAEMGVAIAREQHPDLILMDIQLPGMDGLQATALLKADAATRDIPVLALTALAMKGDEERIRAAGCDGYIAKPLDYKAFLGEVKATLAAPHITRRPG
jgi:two-component system cell cycle response regulator DivK